MIQAQKGTKDILPSEVENWHRMENAANKVFSKANFKEIRTPIFEATELFARGVGDSTDIVNKEMYTFEKSDRSLEVRQTAFSPLTSPRSSSTQTNCTGLPGV